MHIFYWVPANVQVSRALPQHFGDISSASAVINATDLFGPHPLSRFIDMVAANTLEGSRQL